MNYITHLNNFFTCIKTDKRLTPPHVSLYMALFQYWNYNRFQNPFSIYRDDIMQLSRIGSKNTYHKCIKELHHARYITYYPAPSRYQPVKISITNLERKHEKDPRQLNLFNTSKPQHTSPGIDTNTSPKSDTLHVPHLTAASPNSGTRSVSKVGHLIKHINNKQERDPPDGKIYIKKERIKWQLNTPAHVPKMGHSGSPPSITEIKDFFKANNYHNAETESAKFFHHYEAIGWKLSGSHIRNWQALVEKWITNSEKFNNTNNTKTNGRTQQQQQYNPAPDPDYSEPL